MESLFYFSFIAVVRVALVISKADTDFTIPQMVEGRGTAVEF